MADPGGYFLRQRSRVAEGVRLHGSPDLPAGTRGPPQGGAALEREGPAGGVRSPAGRVRRHRSRREGRPATAAPGGRLRRGVHVADAAAEGRARRLHDHRQLARTATAAAASRCRSTASRSSKSRSSAPQKFYLQGTTTKVTVRARYYFGQPVSHGTVKLVTYSSGYWSPWKYISSDGDEGEGGEPGYYGDEGDEYEAELDEKGEATISVDIPEADSDGDLAVRLEARVTDAVRARGQRAHVRRRDAGPVGGRRRHRALRAGARQHRQRPRARGGLHRQAPRPTCR